MVDLPASKKPPYLLYNVGLFVSFIGPYLSLNYLQLFAVDRQITNDNLAFYLVSIPNSTSTAGRISNFIAERASLFNMIVPYAIFYGILIPCFLAVYTQGQLLVVAILHGSSSGSFVSLSPSILVSLCPNQGVVGIRMGLSFTVMDVSLFVAYQWQARYQTRGFWACVFAETSSLPQIA